MCVKISCVLTQHIEMVKMSCELHNENEKHKTKLSSTNFPLFIFDLQTLARIGTHTYEKLISVDNEVQI